jgi:hypothetical protein
MSNYSTRNIIDYAMDDDGIKFREALYASIHDKVTNHIDAARQAVAQNMMAVEETEKTYEEVEEVEQIDELSKKTLTSYVGKAYKDQGVRMAAAGALAAHHAEKTGKIPTAKEVGKMMGKDEVRKDKNRDSGVGRALSRLSTEE